MSRFSGSPSLDSRRRLLSSAAALLLVWPVAACSGPAGRAPRPDLAFDALPPLAFDAAELQVRLLYVPPGQPPFVDHLFSLTPLQAATLWARDRLVAAGRTRRLVFEVNEASVVQSLVEGEGGSGLLSMTEQILRYDARMVINVHLYEDSGFQSATAKVTGERAVTVPEAAGEVARDKAWNQLLTDLMGDMDVQLEATLSEVFRDYRVE